MTFTLQLTLISLVTRFFSSNSELFKLFKLFKSFKLVKLVKLICNCLDVGISIFSLGLFPRKP
jgi:hypothetical protein